MKSDWWFPFLIGGLALLAVLLIWGCLALAGSGSAIFSGN